MKKGPRGLSFTLKQKRSGILFTHDRALSVSPDEAGHVTTCGIVRNSVQTLEASKKDRSFKFLGLNLSVDCLTCPSKEKLERR